MDAIKEIAAVLAKIDDRILIKDFLVSILTENEIKEIHGRWDLVKLLYQGVSQRTIARRESWSCWYAGGQRRCTGPSTWKRPYRKLMMQTWGGTCVASPSNETQAGRDILAMDPGFPGQSRHCHQ